MKKSPNKFLKYFPVKSLALVIIIAVAFGVVLHRRSARTKTNESALISAANQYIAHHDLFHAASSLQSALALNPSSAPATDAMADLLESVGAPDALTWRIKSAKLDPHNAAKRLDWAELAIKANDFPSAAEALNGIDEKSANTAQYHKLKGALAWNIHHAAEAEEQYLAAAQLEPQNPAIQENLAIIRLESTNAAIAEAARASLEQISTNDALRLSALRQLLANALAHKSFSAAQNYSARIVKEPSASADDDMQHLRLLQQNRSPDFSAWLESLEKRSQDSPEQAFLLGRWKALTDGPTNALHWLTSLPDHVQTNLPVPIVKTDCQIAMKDWPAILAEVKSEDWGGANYYKFALQSLAERSLSQKAAADASWNNALELSSRSLDRLSRLAEVTGVWGWSAEKIDVLSEIVGEFPEESWALDQLSSELYAQGKTSEMESLFFKAYSRDPSNPRIENNLANLYLLQKTELPKAFAMAQDAYNSSTNNPFFVSTYAYALLLQDKKADALNVVNGLKTEYLKIPSVAVYYGIVQAESGRKEIARDALKRAEAGNLLPEERAIVQLAKSQM